MLYRDTGDALRERIESLKREIEHARGELDRIAALERELADARERLALIEAAPPAAGRLRSCALVLCGVLIASMGAMAILKWRSVALPDPPEARPPAEIELDAPPGWTSRTEDVKDQAQTPYRAEGGPDRWTQLTSPDGKARVWYTRVNATSKLKYLWEAESQLCPSAGGGEIHQEARRIGPDRLPAWYDEVPCAGERATVVGVDLFYGYPDPLGPLSTASRDSYAKNHLVLASRLEDGCPEARRQEVASMLASIRRKR